MRSVLLRRLLGTIPLVFGISTLVFFLAHAAPGDPTLLFLSDDSDPAVAAHLRQNFGLDRPLHEQYFRWLARLAQGDFGHSFAQKRPVAEILMEAVPNTLLLSSVSLVLLFAGGIGIGVLSAIRKGTWLDRIATLLSFFFYSMPSFWLALMLLLLFSYHFDWLPASQMHSLSFQYEAFSWWGKLGDRLVHLALPALALSLGTLAGVARYARAGMLEAMQQDFVRTARAKGLPEGTVIWKHAFRNALLPMITLLGLYIPFLISGAVIVETIFAWPGMGRVAITAIFQRDYPVVMATTILSACLVVLGSLLADLLYSWADPRIRVPSGRQAAGTGGTPQ
ncbi:MAG: ABC transporter permease [Gemmatimonadetes bacterium]|nr:ABC transporter permease [Gemmatimonadota bacterium]